jgi:thiol-disulfide isomerase/thioredoxin
VSLFGKAELASEGRIPGFDGATGWLNSPPLSVADLQGKVVLVNFWTYTCINWLRTFGYVRAWAKKYADQGLVVVGVHTPEFPFEHDVDNVRTAAKDMEVEYPVALDNGYVVWDAFANRYWPATYVADADGRIRHHRFGEGGYEEIERVVQQLLRASGRADIGDELVSVPDEGFEAQADWANLETQETYLGYDQAQNFASGGDSGFGGPRMYVVPHDLRVNQWALSGEWTVESRASVLNRADGKIAFRFHARDVNLVMSPAARDTSVEFSVLVDGEPPGDAHGLDVDDRGRGTVAQQRLYQLIRQPGSITDRTFEISFLAPGVEAYAFTFG